MFRKSSNKNSFYLKWYDSLYFKMGIGVTILIFVIELILLIASINSREAELREINKSFIEKQLDSGVSEAKLIHVYPEEKITEMLKNYTLNIIGLVLIIIFFVVTGTIFVFHKIIGYHLLEMYKHHMSKINSLNLISIPKKKIPKNELGMIMISENEMVKNLLEMSENLIQSSKLASLGQMAGGVAHEINNPLAIISGSVKMLVKAKQQGKLSDDIFDKNVERIETTIERITKIISGLRTVSRDSDSLEIVPVVISDLFEDVLGLCSEKFKSHGIDLTINLDDPIIRKKVLGDRVQISQVFLNLLSNSFDAIERLEERWVKIEFTQKKQEITIKIIDSGNKIPKEIQDKMFTPFYTSKEVGKGTGLGLSLSKTIISNNNGSLEIDNSHKNTCFTVKLNLFNETKS